MKSPVMIQTAAKVTNQSSELGALESLARSTRTDEDRNDQVRREMQGKSLSSMYRLSCFDSPWDPFSEYQRGTGFLDRKIPARVQRVFERRS